jgi:hypothetical protein
MRQLVTSGDMSYIISVQIALDAEDIPHSDTLRGRYGASLEGPNCILVADADHARATLIVSQLQRTSPPTLDDRGGRIVKVIGASMLLLVLLVFVLRIVIALTGAD